MLIDRLNEIINKFEGTEKEQLIEYFITVSINKNLNEKPISKSKISLLYHIKAIGPSKYEHEKENIMRHKAIQTRALVLDMINTDYTIDVKYIVRPEKWIYKITEDIKNCELSEDLLALYNKYLISEFEDIFVNKVEKYGSNGNQLLVNFYYYKNFMHEYFNYDFDKFLMKIRNQIISGKAYKEEEIINILVNA